MAETPAGWGSFFGSAMTPVWVGTLVFGLCFLVELIGLALVKMSIPG